MTYHAALALTEAAFRERWNRYWRFSRGKLGLWLFLLQLALAAGAVWRFGDQRGVTSFGAAAMAMLLQAGVWSFMSVFLTGRNKLYGNRGAVLLVHISPAPSWSVLFGEVVVGLPGRAWSMLVWAGMLGQLLPGGAWWWAVPGLWLEGLVVGSLGQLAGLMVLVAWVRAQPRALAATWAAVLVLQLALMYFVLYLVVTGQPLEGLASLRWWAVGGLAAALGLPGAVLLAWLAAAPGRAGSAYREGWLGLAELGDSSARPRRSRWPALVPLGAGAVQAREWLYAARNPFTLFRIAVTAGLLVTLFPFGSRLAGAHAEQAALGAGLGLVFFAFCEMAAAIFSNEGARTALWVVTGASPAGVLLGKLTALTPYALLSAASAWLAGLAVGVAGPGALALQGGLAGLGMAAVMAGLGALDVKIAEVQEEDPETEGFSFALEQVPRGVFSVAGMVLAGLLGAGAVLWPHPVIWLAPVAALGAGYLRLHRLLRQGA